MSWIKIDDGFYRNEKRWELELEGVGLWLVCLCYAGDQLTDGFVPEKFVRSNVPSGDRRGIVKTLLLAGLLEKVDKGYQIPKFLDYNPSRAEVEAQRSELSKKRSEAGRKGAAAKWSSTENPHVNERDFCTGSEDFGHALNVALGDGSGSDKPNPDGKAMANGMANGWQPDGPVPVPHKSQKTTLRVVEGDAGAWVDELVPDPRLDEDDLSSGMTA